MSESTTQHERVSQNDSVPGDGAPADEEACPAPPPEADGQREVKTEGGRRLTLPVEGMSCASCAKSVEGALSRVEGVTGASVNFATERAEVYVEESEARVRDLVCAVEDSGYEVRTTETTLTVQGMSCASCVSRVEDSLASLDGVVEVNVNLATDRATVQYVPGTVTPADFTTVIRDAGYDVTVPFERAPTV